MTVKEIINGLIAQKQKIGLTNQQWSDASGVPCSTIKRIVSGETPNPTMQTLLDLASAVGYDFSTRDGPAVKGQDTETLDPMVRHLIHVYDGQARANEERIKRNTAHFHMLLAEKNRWLIFSLTLNIILVAVIIGVLAWDVTHPDIGWIREQLGITSRGEFGFRIWTALKNIFTV